MSEIEHPLSRHRLRKPRLITFCLLLPYGGVSGVEGGYCVVLIVHLRDYETCRHDMCACQACVLRTPPARLHYVHDCSNQPIESWNRADRAAESIVVALQRIRNVGEGAQLSATGQARGILLGRFHPWNRPPHIAQPSLTCARKSHKSHQGDGREQSHSTLDSSDSAPALSHLQNSPSPPPL